MFRPKFLDKTNNTADENHHADNDNRCGGLMEIVRIPYIRYKGYNGQHEQNYGKRVNKGSAEPKSYGIRFSGDNIVVPIFFLHDLDLLQPKPVSRDTQIVIQSGRITMSVFFHTVV
jgi:hypothetical protein